MELYELPIQITLLLHVLKQCHGLIVTVHFGYTEDTVIWDFSATCGHIATLMVGFGWEEIKHIMYLFPTMAHKFQVRTANFYCNQDRIRSYLVSNETAVIEGTCTEV